MTLWKATDRGLRRTVTRVTYRFQSSDVRLYYFEDVVNRVRNAVQRAGGEVVGGIRYLPKKIHRWTVLRSPHVYKKSREKFWVVNRLRVFHWDAPAHVDAKASQFISHSMPANVALRTLENSPGLRSLRSLFDTVDRVNGEGRNKQNMNTEEVREDNNDEESEDLVREDGSTDEKSKDENL